MLQKHQINQNSFELVSDYEPCGHQPQAIEKLVTQLEKGDTKQTLLGVTGSGKTYTIANVIEQTNLSTLVITPNKTLCRQLYSEFAGYFPNNATQYFVSAYDFFQPEAYVPITQNYIEKKVALNQEIHQMQQRTKVSLSTRSDVIVTASVSCLFGITNPQQFREDRLYLEVGEFIRRDELLRNLVKIRYDRNDITPKQAEFRVKGDVVEIYPLTEDNMFRIEFFGDEIDRITEINPITYETITQRDHISLYPEGFIPPQERLTEALEGVEQELIEREHYFLSQGKYLEAQRIRERTRYDMEVIRLHGTCPGIENYNKYFLELEEDQPPYCLLDYFPEDFLIVIDESHITMSQLKAMFHGSQSRVQMLVEHGFRLPSALSNRPLQFHEVEERLKKAIFVSATPNTYEIENSDHVVEQLIRPTGLIDPPVSIKTVEGQYELLLEKISGRVANDERVLITTTTKKQAEQLSETLIDDGVKAVYLHGEIKVLDRTEILKDFRRGIYDVIVGINLLREGLDLPEVSLVAILSADQRGFLRSTSSLVQIIGRTARNVNGEVILFANNMTPAMEEAIDETNRRRIIQTKYNEDNDITPKTVKRLSIEDLDYLPDPADTDEEIQKSLRDDEFMKKLAV